MKRRHAPARGFTLIEVLIALAIVAIALGAILRAMGQMASDTEDERARMLALWSADNALSELRVSQVWPPVGYAAFACPQGRYRFVCHQTTTALSDPRLREVSVSVYPSSAGGAVLAEVVSVIQNEARF